ncbi:MAG: hypothetical protein ACRD0S_05770, partial [Acidimicrobiales bacterium]
TWSWQAASTDGRTQVSSNFKALRTEDVAVGPAQVPALVVEVRLTTTGDVVITSTQTMWVVPRLGLVVRLDDATEGSFGAVGFKSTASEKLVSLDPA